jgi:hypothetical protein
MHKLLRQFSRSGQYNTSSLKIDSKEEVVFGVRIEVEYISDLPTPTGSPMYIRLVNVLNDENIANTKVVKVSEDKAISFVDNELVFRVTLLLIDKSFFEKAEYLLQIVEPDNEVSSELRVKKVLGELILNVGQFCPIDEDEMETSLNVLQDFQYSEEDMDMTTKVNLHLNISVQKQSSAVEDL